MGFVICNATVAENAFGTQNQNVGRCFVIRKTGSVCLNS